MTARTPPPQSYRNFGNEPNANRNTIDYNGPNTNKAGINQSSVGGNNPNTSTEEKKSYYAKPVENYGALFDTEILYVPPKRKEPEKTLVQESPRQDKSINKGDLNGVNTYRKDFTDNRQETYTALERGLRNTRDRVQAVDDKVEALDSNWKGVPHQLGEAETKMAAEGYRVDELEWRNKLHSAKIHDLENELRNVKMENSRIKGQIGGRMPGAPIPEEDYRNGYNERDRPYDRNQPPQGNYQAQQGYPGAREMGERQRGQPQASQQAPPAKGRQYENEQHKIAHRVGGPDEEPYWGFNKYYDPQFVTAYRREHIPYYAKLEEKEKSQQPPGGLYLIRFHDSGYDEVTVSLKEQQTIIKSFHGYILGVARKQNIMVIEGDAEWRYSRQQVHRPQIRVNYRSVEDAIAVLWFPSRDKAFDFFSNSFRNRFRQQGFPTPHSWEGHYIPMLSPPMFRTLDTYLILELMNAQKYPAENVQAFEAEARQDILKAQPNSLPFVASAFKGRDSFKPGPLFRDKSKVFICRFNSMSDLAEIWDRGVIQRQLEKWNLTGPLNVSALSLKDWMDF